MPIPTLDEQAKRCFGCGPDNSQGLHLRFTLATDPASGLPIATAQVNLTHLHEGPPGYIHGGIIATLLDEAMSKLNRPLDALAVTRHMEIDYLRPAPLNSPLLLIGRHLSRPVDANGTAGRKLFHTAELQTARGEVLARAKGLFIALNPDDVKAATSSTAQREH